MMTPAKKSFILNTLRRGTYRWYGRWQAEKRSNLGRNQYYCENPECGVIGKKKEFQMDHKIPVVLTSGWDSWEGVLDRMYCDPDQMWRLCKPCHGEKTAAENRLRPRPPKKPKRISKKRAKSS